jgi:hypothetical protein
MKIEENHITAEKGKVFRHKESGDIISNELWLGILDSADNYEEIDKPIEE